MSVQAIPEVDQQRAQPYSLWVAMGVALGILASDIWFVNAPWCAQGLRIERLVSASLLAGALLLVVLATIAVRQAHGVVARGVAVALVILGVATLALGGFAVREAWGQDTCAVALLASASY